eukprot:g4175.t1
MFCVGNVRCPDTSRVSCLQEIVGQDIGAPALQSGRAIPSQPKRPKVEVVSEDEDEDDDDEVPPLAAAQPAEDRSEVEEGAEVRKNAVHVYGLDFLKTHHMEEIFVQFGHKYVEWINASSANIIFKNAEGAKKALEALSFPKTEDEPWRRTPDILVSEGVPPIFLQMRLATVNDVKKAKKAVPKAMSPMHYAQVFYKNQQQAIREGTLTGMDPKAKPKAGIKRLIVTEEEQQKRQRRADRFEGEVTVVQGSDAEKKGAAEGEAADAEALVDKAANTDAPGKEAADAEASVDKAGGRYGWRLKEPYRTGPKCSSQEFGPKRTGSKMRWRGEFLLLTLAAARKVTDTHRVLASSRLDASQEVKADAGLTPDDCKKFTEAFVLELDSLCTFENLTNGWAWASPSISLIMLTLYLKEKDKKEQV